MKLNKKGSLNDLLGIGVILLFFGIVILFGYLFTSNINDKIQAMPQIAELNPEGQARAVTAQLTGYYPGVIDNMFLVLVVGLSIVTLVLAALVRIHPVFIPFFFIGLVLVIIFSGILSNVYQEMAANERLEPYATNLVFASNVLEFLPFIIGIIGIILMVVMYKTWQNV